MEDALSIARDIADRLDKLTELIDVGTALALSSKAIAQDVRRDFRAEDSSINRPRVNQRFLVSTLAKRTHDVQLHLTPARLSDIMSDRQIDPIFVNMGPISATLKQAGSMTIDWLSSGKLTELTIRLPLRISIQHQSEQARILSVPTILAVDRQSNSASLRLTGEPEFLDPNTNEVTDFLGSIPSKDRSRARIQLRSSVRAALLSFKINFESYGLELFGHAFRPSFCLTSSALLICGHARASLHAPIPLTENISRQAYGQAITFRTDLIRAEMTKRIRKYDARLLEMTLQSGRIHTKSFRSRSESHCHITVKGRAWISHDIFIREDRPGELFASAHWRSYSWKIKAKRCWPVCGRVLREAEKVMETEIDKVKFLTFPFADLRHIARRSYARIHTHGVTILMKAR